MKVLVTGAGGFIGGHMANYLKKKGYEVITCDIKPNPWQPVPNFHLADLRNYSNCRRLVEGVDWVFQFAANMGGIGFISRVKADVMHDNALINANMLRASVDAGVKRFFFASSACIYPYDLQRDSSKVVYLKESDAFPAYPDSAYGWEKLFTEIMCKSFQEDYGLEVRIARYHNIYGPYGTYKGGREKAPAALCRKVAEAEDGGSIVIWGNGKQIRSFLYIDDCLEATYRLMKSDYNEPLNIGSDQAITIDELADIIIEISGKKLTKKYDPSKPVGVRSRNADLTLLEQVLGWRPKVSYREGLEKTYKWIEERVKRDHTCKG